MKNFIMSVALAIVFTFIIVLVMPVKDIPAPTETTEESYTYIICDVVDINIESGEFNVLMQTGDIETYSAADLPFEFDTVCFKTTNLEDFTTYEVVALR